jgi:hydroxymethylbilane synthase
MTDQPVLRIGTRGSPLALAQTGHVIDRLKELQTSLVRKGAVETIVITTTGDRVQDRALAAIGGKGLFTKELDEALLDDRIDIGVHSMKDMPTVIPDGIQLYAIMRRADPRDAFISNKAKTVAELPEGARVGTSSLRRKAQLLRLRPDLRVAPRRGNVDTRLRKLADGEASKRPLPRPSIPTT